jgi:hypothetical protein
MTRLSKKKQRRSSVYRTIRIAAIAAAATMLPAQAGLAFGIGSGSGNSGAPISSATLVASQVGSKPGGATASPNVRKLSPKGGAACFRACMHGMGNSVSWGNFCDYSCYGP